MIQSLLAFLRCLFRRRQRSAAVIPTAPPELSPAAPETLPEAAPPERAPVETPSDPAAAEDCDEDEDWGGDEGDDWTDDEEPDPFITGTALPDILPHEDVEARRARARADALQGEHRVYLSNPAGPGSLAEALNLLLVEGLVEACFVDDADEGPYILYRPAS